MIATRPNKAFSLPFQASSDALTAPFAKPFQERFA